MITEAKTSMPAGRRTIRISSREAERKPDDGQLNLFGNECEGMCGV